MAFTPWPPLATKATKVFTNRNLKIKRSRGNTNNFQCVTLEQQKQEHNPKEGTMNTRDEYKEMKHLQAMEHFGTEVVIQTRALISFADPEWDGVSTSGKFGWDFRTYIRQQPDGVYGYRLICVRPGMYVGPGIGKELGFITKRGYMYTKNKYLIDQYAVSEQGKHVGRTKVLSAAPWISGTTSRRLRTAVREMENEIEEIKENVKEWKETEHARAKAA